MTIPKAVSDYMRKIGEPGRRSRGWKKSAGGRRGIRERWRRVRALNRGADPCAKCWHGPEFDKCLDQCVSGRAHKARLTVGHIDAD